MSQIIFVYFIGDFLMISKGFTQFSLILFLFISTNIILSQNKPNIITTDIDNFWTAYDKIVTTKDNAQQLEFLNKLFIEKASIGQQEMFRARRYAPQEYIDSINKRPEYWTSIRQNTLKAKDFATQFEDGIEKLRLIYPELKLANIYFTVGVFRSGGTTSGNNILIGSEIVFADDKNMKDLAFTNVHEYVHTQQKSGENENLLERSAREGIAEFVTVKALNLPSFTPAIEFGKNNEPRIKNAFAQQMFNSSYSFWLYNDAENQFKTRDLGYYVGYAVAEKFYEKAKDKRLAIQELIDLDFNNSLSVEKYIDSTNYFPKSIKNLKKDFEKSRPKVVGIKPFKNGSKNVSPNISQLTVEFSSAMHKNYRNFQFGPLGESNSVKLTKMIGLSEDGKSISFEIEPLKPNKRYQLIIGEGFRNKMEVQIKPYLIDFTTADK